MQQTNSKIENKYFNALNLIPNLGPKSQIKLVNYFKDIESAWHGSLDDYKKAGITSKAANSILKTRTIINLEEEFLKLEKEGIEILTIEDPGYPKSLKQIHDPPVVLYTRGKIENTDDFAIGVVGSRKTTSYGKIVTQEIVRELATNGLTIVSGLAMGIDTEAHTAALQNKGRTIAVLGSGLDWNHIYPQMNKKLVERIIEDNGAVISEFPYGTVPNKFNFPRRNRVVSGLSKGILVIEASEKSGSLITANYALNQNREIFAIPGDIFKTSYAGTNNLIKKGAKLVTTANDILEELDLTDIKQYSSARKLVADNPDEEKILAVLSKDPIYKDQIIRKIELDPAKVLSTLSLMEIKGYVKDVGGGKFVTV